MVRDTLELENRDEEKKWGKKKSRQRKKGWEGKKEKIK